MTWTLGWLDVTLITMGVLFAGAWAAAIREAILTWRDRRR